MKKIIFIGIAASLFTACGIYKPYTRPEVRTDDLYGAEYATADTASIADIGWRELFTDRLLQRLIDTALVHNTDLQVARLRITEAEATLKAARLAYLPSFSFAPTAVRAASTARKPRGRTTFPSRRAGRSIFSVA